MEVWEVGPRTFVLFPKFVHSDGLLRLNRCVVSAKCSHGSAVLFIRSAHSRNEKGRNLDTVSNISEDDCLFSCLTNKAADSHPVQCASAEYDQSGGRCTLSSEPRANELTEHPSAVFYEKICVAREFFLAFTFVPCSLLLS
ncbi:PAN domain protein, partial [Ostertagia ostertagi]